MGGSWRISCILLNMYNGRAMGTYFQLQPLSHCLICEPEDNSNPLIKAFLDYGLSWEQVHSSQEAPTYLRYYNKPSSTQANILALSCLIPIPTSSAVQPCRQRSHQHFLVSEHPQRTLLQSHQPCGSLPVPARQWLQPPAQKHTRWVHPETTAE